MKGKFKSLKFRLLLDLSLLTLSALVIGEGILVVLIRSQMPGDLNAVANNYLKSLHETFIYSTEFKEAAGTAKFKRADKVTESFKAFYDRKNLQYDWASVNVEVFSSPDPEKDYNSEVVISKKSKIFWSIPVIQEFGFLTKHSNDLYFEYHWSVQPIHSFLTGVKYNVFFMTIIILLILVGLGYILLIRPSVLHPISNLAKQAQAYLRGEWSERVEIERKDELGDVAEALNEMGDSIQEKQRKLMLTIESLKAVNEELELKQNEQLQIEKLASVGRLAAGVAHEVGNPLGAISGYVDILRRSIKGMKDANAEDVDLCDRIEQETNRISRIIRSLLQQARPAKERIKGVALLPILQRSVELSQVEPAIKIEYEIENENAEVLAEPDQLVQIFLNLLVNAKHAIEGKDGAGKIKIQCSLRRLPVYKGTGGGISDSEMDTSVVRSLEPKTYWVTTIVDDGIGIGDEDQKKLFEPFFSTKAPGKGTGLGLYVTKSVVESFGGAIVVRSALGYGSSFSIFLPQKD